MLDTNTASYVIKGEPISIREHLKKVPMASICISTVTEAELLLGVAKKPEAIHLPLIVKEFLSRVEILPWDSGAAKAYAELRNTCERKGKSLGAMDMLIAAHSISSRSVLVTSDKAFYQISDLLTLENWAADPA